MVNKKPIQVRAWDVFYARHDFPILQTQMGGKDLVYLDNAATTQKPQQVLEAIQDFYSTKNANVHRGAYDLSFYATEAYEQARRSIAEHIHACQSREVIFTHGATESINLVAQSWGRQNLRPGDLILTTELEHHSNFLPWIMVAQEKGAKVRSIPVDDGGNLCLDTYEKLLQEGPVRLVAVTHLSNVLGIVNPLSFIIQRAKAHGALVLVDAAQSLVHLPIDVTALDCDFLAASGHKAYGPTGIGFLYGKAHLLEQMPPYMTGGGMVQKVSPDGITFRDIPEKLEPGTPHICGAIAFKAALDYLNQWDFKAIQQHESALLQSARELLGEIPGIRLLGSAPEMHSVLSFVFSNVHPHDVASVLNTHGIAARAGNHCCQPLMRHLKVPGTLRLSFALYNTQAEVQKVYTALQTLAHLFR